MRSSLVFAIALLLCGDVSAQTARARKRAVGRSQSCQASQVVSATEVTDLAVDSSHVYFGDRRGNVWRAVKSGGSPERVTSMADRIVTFLALDASTVYFEAQDRSGFDSVYAVPKGGGEPRLLVSNLRWALDMIPDGDWLYVLSAGSLGPPPWPSDGRIMRVRKDGSALETLAAPLRAPMGMRLDGETIYFTEAGISPVDTTGGVRSMLKSGGAVSTLATITAAWSMTHDSGSLYVVRIIASDLGAIDVVSKADGSVRPLLPQVSFEPWEPMEVTRGSLLFMNLVSSTSARIESIPVSGGDRKTIREFARNFPRFSPDGCAVYFSTPAGIERAPY